MKNNYIIIDLETNGATPLANRITAIGCKTSDEERCFCDVDEKKMITEFWAWVSRVRSETAREICFIGFNVYAFDLKFLHFRSMKHGIAVPICTKDNYVDLRYELQFYERFAKGSLNDYANYIGVGGKTGDGVGAIILWEELKLAELQKYCMMDVKITYDLFLRCIKCGILTKNTLMRSFNE